MVVEDLAYSSLDRTTLVPRLFVAFFVAAARRLGSSADTAGLAQGLRHSGRRHMGAAMKARKAEGTAS